MNVKNIKSFIDFYKSLDISTCIAPFPRILNNENNKTLILFFLTYKCPLCGGSKLPPSTPIFSKLFFTKSYSLTTFLPLTMYL